MPVVCLIPAYNAQATVGRVVEELAKAWPQELGSRSILVVDDGSEDETAQIAEAAGARVVQHGVNRGKGAALRTGLEKAAELGAAMAVSLDADGQHPPAEALRLAQHPAPEDALVLGVRDMATEGVPKANRWSNGFSNLVISLFTFKRLYDTQCGLRRYPVHATLDLGLADTGYAFEAEVIMRAVYAGWSIAHVPTRVIYPPAEERVSHFDSVRDPTRIVYRVLVTLARAGRS